MAYRLDEIAQKIGARCEGDGALMIERPAEPAAATERDLALAMDPHFVAQLPLGQARAALVREDVDWRGLGLQGAIRIARPRYAMAGITSYFDRPRSPAKGIDPLASIDPRAVLAEDVQIGPFVRIEAGARIGTGTRIFASASVGADAILAEDCTIFEGARIGHAVEIGARTLVQMNAVVGSDGFSFVTPEPGAVEEFRAAQKISTGQSTQPHARIHSLGRVLIGEDVEIGAGSCIDRGTIADTVIGSGTKIDNLVHIGHNVTVGAACLLCGQVGVAGSVTLGDRVVMGGKSAVADHVRIGSDVVVAGFSGVSSNVPSNRVMMGYPALPMDIFLEAHKVFRRLPRLKAALATLQKQVSKSAKLD